MSKNGGYKIIDFGGVSLTSGSEKTFPGIYDAIEATNKRTVVSGLVVGGTEYDDMPVVFTVDSTNYVGVVWLADDTYISFVIADDDGVTVSVVTEG